MTHFFGSVVRQHSMTENTKHNKELTSCPRVDIQREGKGLGLCPRTFAGTGDDLKSLIL